MFSTAVCARSNLFDRGVCAEREKNAQSEKEIWTEKSAPANSRGSFRPFRQDEMRVVVDRQYQGE
jgi:hypothetical protein